MKLLELTSSDHDGEALAAIRKANELLEAKGLRWAQFIEQLTGIPEKQLRSSDQPRTARRGTMTYTELEAIFEQIDSLYHLLSDNQKDWVERMREAWENATSLSKRQEEIVTNILREVEEKAERRSARRW